MDESKKAIVFIVLCTFFTSAGQILWKLGLQSVDFNHFWTLFDPYFIAGFVSYGLGLILMLAAFAKGKLSVVYPILATSYVWVSLFSPMIFPEDSMNVFKWIGVVVILVSVSLIGYGSAVSRQKHVLGGGDMDG